MGSVERARRSLRHQVGRHQRQLDQAMAGLGLLLLIVVVVDLLVPSRTVSSILEVFGYLLWGVFIAEFLLRWWLAPDRVRFFRHQWWRLVLLAVPFLRFVRALAPFRVAAFGRAIASVLRGSSSAARLLAERLVWLSALTVLVILTSSYLLYVTGAFHSYLQALYHSAFSTISGEPLGVESVLGQVLQIVLAAYSVIVFAALAGSIGAYFLGDRRPGRDREGEEKQ